jgi:hypothetical protein
MIFFQFMACRLCVWRSVVVLSGSVTLEREAATLDNDMVSFTLQAVEDFRA